MYGRIFKFHIAPWVSKAQPCKRFFSAKTELNAILQREIDEEEGNLAEMDEHYEDDVYELNRRFSKVKLEDYDPIITLEKTDDEGKHMRVRCNIEDQVDDVHYLDVSISNNENKTIGFMVRQIATGYFAKEHRIEIDTSSERGVPERRRQRRPGDQ